MDSAIVEPDSKRDLTTGRIILRLLKLAWRYRWGCTGVLFLQILLLTIGLSGLSMTGVGIDFIRHHIDLATRAPRWPFGLVPPDTLGLYGTLGLIAGIIFLFALTRTMINTIYQICLANLVQGKIVVDLRADVYNKLQRLSFRFFDENESGSIINRVTRDVQAVRMFIDGVLIQGVTLLLSLGVFFIYMVNIHFRLTVACLATIPLLWLISLRFSNQVKPAYKKNRELMDRLVLVLSESLQGIRVIKGFAREPETVNRYTGSNRSVRDQIFWVFNKVSTFGPTINVLTQVNLMILLLYGGYLVINDQLPLGTGLIVFSGLLQQFSSQVASLANLTNAVQDCLTASRRVFEVLDAPVEIDSKPGAIIITDHAPCAVEFDHVEFGYSSVDPVLRDVTFRVEPGECVAVVGATGSGKSTLLSLIPRFYDVQKGVVRLNGIDVRDLELDSVRRNVGIVFQENFLFSNTIRANISFGQPKAPQEQIRRAAEIAAAHDFISELKKGYDTILGEGGSGLSGGQRQRIAIARAILLEPSILLLDDPTAAIDPETEHDIMNAMESAMKGRTTFIVAHRLSTLRRADKIIVLSDGKIAQIGTHEELMSMKGPYRWMVSLQIIDDESRQILESQENGTETA